MDKEQNDFACFVLNKFVTSKDARLKHGAGQRLKMKKTIESGQKPSGYRAEWIIATMQKVIRVLIESAEDFDKTYWHDMISVDDMADVLQSASNALTKKSKKN